MPKANKADNQNEDLAFEPALASLEQLVQQMESGELSLEQSIQAFEQGMKLSQQCQKALDEAEQKVQLLMAQADGGVETQDIDQESD